MTFEEPLTQGTVAYCCECPRELQMPTHRHNVSDATKTFWCKNCGKQLRLRHMDEYAYSPEYRKREEELKEVFSTS